MKNLYLVALVLALVGCSAHNPQQPPLPEKIAIKYKYVLVTVDEKFLEIPESVPNIDVTPGGTATDKDAAKWILDKEERAQNIETKLKAIKTNQDLKLKEIQTDMKIPKEDLIIK